jgi:hypothetical protein
VKRVGVLICTAVLAAPLLGGCTGAAPGSATVPRCSSIERLGLIAQSVPTAGYIPCITRLGTGWHSDELVIRNGATTFELVSDRAENHPVRVAFRSGCDVAGGAPVPPRTLGGRSYLALHTISPRVTGTLYDVFPGGCVTYGFDFQRGPHIALMADLQSSVGLLARVELDRSLRRELGVHLP